MEHSLATELTRQLIQIESTDPGTYELTIKDWICSWLTSALHADVRLYQDEVLPNRFNLMAELPGTDPGLPALVWICHMDTVVVGNGWTVPPFSALERDGKIYGRGACDMKSGLACCLSAFSYAAQKSISTPPRRTLKLICTVDEEDFMRGSERCIQSRLGHKRRLDSGCRTNQRADPGCPQRTDLVRDHSHRAHGSCQYAMERGRRRCRHGGDHS